MLLLTAPGFHDEGFVIQLIVNAALIFAGKLYQILKRNHLRKRSLVPQSRWVLVLLSGKHMIAYEFRVLYFGSQQMSALLPESC